MSSLTLSVILGFVAGLADFLGGFLLVRRSPSAKALRYFVALGAGFMLAAAVLEMIPEGLHLNPQWTPLLILAGYCGGVGDAYFLRWGGDRVGVCGVALAGVGSVLRGVSA